MTEQEIRDGAPSGATHYFDDVVFNYHKIVDGVDYYYRDGLWIESAFNVYDDPAIYLKPL